MIIRFSKSHYLEDSSVDLSFPNFCKNARKGGDGDTYPEVKIENKAWKITQHPKDTQQPKLLHSFGVKIHSKNVA